MIKNLLLCVLIITVSVGCNTASWLPSKSVNTQTQWKSYEELQSVVKGIKRGHTLEDVKRLGLDVNTTPNVQLLTYLDIAKRFGLIGLKDKSVTIPDGVKRLMDAAEKGKGYELNVQATEHNRVGSFWADFFQFRKNTHTTGWQLSVLLIVVDDKVEYILYKGNPNIDKLEKEKNPLGPFQKISGYIIVDLLAD
tara:strand:+ start:1091 stop:1672 length:582 start_codon:yes stop_codon:yes gene_type:complete